MLPEFSAALGLKQVPYSGKAPDYLPRNDLAQISRCMGGRLKSLRDSLQTRKIISSTFPKGPQFFPVHVLVITHGKTLG